MNTFTTQRISFADMVTILERDSVRLSPGERNAVRTAYSYALEKGRDPLEECRQALRHVWAAFKHDVSEVEQVREARPARVRTAGSEVEKDHAEALADRIARFGNTEPAVLEVRERLGLPAKGLAPRTALALLRSPLLRFATVQDLARWKVPLLAHRAVIESEKPGKPVAIRVTWKGGKRVLRFGNVALDVPVEFENERRQRERVMACTISVLGDLARVAERLAFWVPFEALWMTRLGAEPACLRLVLTGRVPPIPPVQVGRSVPERVDTITIHALARVVSASTVAAAFSEMQTRILGRRKGRRFDPRSLDVVAFVEREAGGPAHRLDLPSWGKLLKGWNATRRKPYHHAREMRSAYLRAAGSLF